MVTANYQIKDELVYYINSSQLKSKTFSFILEVDDNSSFVRAGLNTLPYVYVYEKCGDIALALIRAGIHPAPL